MEDYNNINTIHFHTPHWLPLTVVPITCNTKFEHTQHLICPIVDHGDIDNYYLNVFFQGTVLCYAMESWRECSCTNIDHMSALATAAALS